jgi:hypothetical protein
VLYIAMMLIIKLNFLIREEMAEEEYQVKDKIFKK